jgi:hypothetical protein
MSLITQAHGLVCGVYVNNMLTIFTPQYFSINLYFIYFYRCADNTLARPERKQATATEDFEFHISYL